MKKYKNIILILNAYMQGKALLYYVQNYKIRSV